MEGFMATHQMIEQGERRREQILAFIRQHIAERGFAPSIAEICKAVEIVSPNAVRNHLQKLQEEGKIEMTPRVARSIRVIEDA